MSYIYICRYLSIWYTVYYTRSVEWLVDGPNKNSLQESNSIAADSIGGGYLHRGRGRTVGGYDDIVAA